MLDVLFHRPTIQHPPSTILSLLLLLASAASAFAAVRYVDVNSANATPPYTSWATAAASIQKAVDAAAAGDEIVVTNGTYATGGRSVGTNVLANRVAVDKPIALRSVNGPQFTLIQGAKASGGGNGDGAIRCVYLADGASLSGFTLTNGATRSVGDSERAQHGGGLWCESTNAVVFNCVMVGNSAAGWGGGAYWGTLNNCTLKGNSAETGGGVAEATLNNCTLRGNSAGSGGGARNGTLNNCTLTGNSASSVGGGAYGDFFVVRLNNCTLTGNSASWGGGVEAGDYGGADLSNCIIYFNTAKEHDNYRGYGVTLNYCCTTPLPASGTGNITLDPQLANATCLSAGSPCRGAGSPAHTSGTDIDGEPWSIPPSIGCDEYHAGAVTGPLSVSIVAGLNNLSAGYPVGLTALIEGRATASVWEFGDGVVVSNRPFATHAWAAPGDYLVTVRAYNESHPAGVSATLAVHVVPQTTHYVSVGSTNPLPPYDSWATAATNIQDAVDAAPLPGALILVTNGVYATGGRPLDGMTNRLAVDKPLIVRSVNGPDFTVIQGEPGTTNFYDAIRCAYLTNGASLSGFTLTNGGAWGGGGLWCESEAAVVSNCVVVGNSSGAEGGGVRNGTLYNCTLTGNSAKGWYSAGGGASYATLNNCTLTGNSATTGDWGYGGGAAWATLNNCTLSGNSANAGGGTFDCVLKDCTLADNWTTSGSGGGAWGGTLNYCTLTGNSASACGGGAGGALLKNCTLTMNSAGDCGGGAWWGTLNNCTLGGNSAVWRGGGFGAWDSGTLTNCIVYFNSAPTGPNYASDYKLPLMHCCTTPQPTNGFGNITNAPLFVDYAGGNLRLQSNSPCINAGNNACAPGPTDLDGLPRIVSGTVDIGAYEFQGPGSVISYAWLQHYGLATDGSADATDPDADGHTTWQEWRCLTDPTNALSVLRLLSASRDGTNVTVSWQSVAGVSYLLERSTNLSPPPLFTPLATGIPGQPGTMTYRDTNADAAPRLFYRVGVP